MMLPPSISFLQAYRTGTTVDEIPYAGFSLVFGTWPVVFGTLKGGEHWVRLLFFDLFLLGIDSAFSILEAPLTVALDWLGHEYAKWKVAGVFCIVAFLLSIMYGTWRPINAVQQAILPCCLASAFTSIVFHNFSLSFLVTVSTATDAGLIFLDTVDFYVNFVILITGFFETLGAGWVYGMSGQIETLGAPAVCSYVFAHFGSIIIACGLWFGLNNENQVWGGFVALFLCFFAGCAATAFFLNQTMQRNPGQWTWSSIVYELCLGNVMRLRDELSSVVGYLPWIWAFALKNMIPQILLLLFINLAQSKSANGESLFGHYGDYVFAPYQILGICIVIFASACIVAGLAFPQLFEGAVRNAHVNQPPAAERLVKELEPENAEETVIKADPTDGVVEEVNC